MRGEVLILVNIPNSHFLLSLTHSALEKTCCILLKVSGNPICPNFTFSNRGGEVAGIV